VPCSRSMGVEVVHPIRGWTRSACGRGPGYVIRGAPAPEPDVRPRRGAPPASSPPSSAGTRRSRRGAVPPRCPRPRAARREARREPRGLRRPRPATLVRCRRVGSRAEEAGIAAFGAGSRFHESPWIKTMVGVDEERAESPERGQVGPRVRPLAPWRGRLPCAGFGSRRHRPRPHHPPLRSPV
jgi:hypothetical protein